MRTLRNMMGCTAVFAAMLSVQIPAGAQQDQMIGINILLKEAVSDRIFADLGTYGQVLDVMPEINALTIRAKASELAAIQTLAYVAAADPDAEYQLASGDGLPVPDFADGANQWALDAINVTDFGATRTVEYDGEGVYVAVIDSGLSHNWREYFPEERIATQFARFFGGGGGLQGTVSSQPDKWEHATDWHGTAVTSVILGFQYSGPEQLPSFFNGVAPKATIIPVVASNKLWVSVATHTVLYVAELKVSGALGNAPLVINASWGGPVEHAMLRAAFEYAIANGVIVVAGAGNDGDAGMIFPARYVISAANAGSVEQLPPDDPSSIVWILRDVPEDDASQYYIAFDSSRALPGQDLDVAAPGTFIPSPWSTQEGKPDYAYFFGTSAACPHVAGVAALMLQKNPGLTQFQVEEILVSTAMPLPTGCREIRVPFRGSGNEPTWSDHSNVFFFEDPVSVCWDSNATGAGLVQADAALDATPLP